MNIISPNSLLPQPPSRRTELYTLLAEICDEIELTDAQYDAAKSTSEAVSAWLSASEHAELQRLEIYFHGSTALGTTVKPLGREEHDVDLICCVIAFSPARPPSELKRLVGDRLRQHAKYAAILEEKKRCWRLNYARAFHLDISPTVPNPACMYGGELVPDKQLRKWWPTNPRGFRALFEKRALLQPRLRMRKAIVADSANIEPFPQQKYHKGILRRIVQLLKRHRDIVFFTVQEDVAPISIIITTLAARAYEFCVNRFDFETELDVVIATIRMMPHFIERPVVGGRRLWVVANETTDGENFADRWNSEPQRATAFFRWHQQALDDFERFASLEGIDRLRTEIGKALGADDVGAVLNRRTETVSAARAARSLFVAPTVGLTTGRAAAATQVRPNTHFGDT